MSDDNDDLFGSDSDDQQDRPSKQPKQRLQQGSARQSGLDDAADDLEDDLGGDAPEPSGRGGDVDGGGAYGNGSDDPEEPGPRATPQNAMEIDAPLIGLPPADQLHLLKMSNILGMDPRPFDPESHAIEEETYVDAENVRRVRIRDDNVIRWRNGFNTTDNTEERQSNARLVRWSDGSMQLLLGEEVLDVKEQDLTSNNTYLYCMRNIIQGQAQLTSRFAFRPASLDSKLHKRLREAVDKRHGKVTKVAAHAQMLNPVKAKEKQEKDADELIKNRELLSRRANKVMDNAIAPRPRAPAGGSGQRLTSQFLEDDDFIDHDDGQDSEEEEEEDRGGRHDDRRRRDLDEDEASRRLQSAKRSAPAAFSGRPPPSRSRRGGEIEEVALPSDGSEEEEDAASTGSEDEGKKRGAKRGRGGDGDGGGKAAAPSAAAAAGNKMKARRGVVLSDDEDD